MQDDNTPTEETPTDLNEAAAEPIEDGQALETSAEGAEPPADEAQAEPEGPSEVAQAIAAMGLTRMSLQELKDKPPVDFWRSPRPSRSRTRTPCASRI